MSWEPPKYMVLPAAQAVLARADEMYPEHSMTQVQAAELAIAALIAGRDAMLNAPLGRRHS